MLCKFPEKFKDQSGFSIIELLIAFGLVTTIGLAESFYLNTSKRLYKPDDQALLITDILQEARQLKNSYVHNPLFQIIDSSTF